uniref:Uncharacterized protein n=1 Tax=Plectus sambesii TaxID=2011161 RepID=A0A914VE49_9BILA
MDANEHVLGSSSRRGRRTGATVASPGVDRGSAEVRTGRTDRFLRRNTIRQLFDSAIAGANKTCRANAVGNLSPPSTGTLLDGQQQRLAEQARRGQRELSRLMGGRVELPPHSVWPEPRSRRTAARHAGSNNTGIIPAVAAAVDARRLQKRRTVSNPIVSARRRSLTSYHAALRSANDLGICALCVSAKDPLVYHGRSSHCRLIAVIKFASIIDALGRPPRDRRTPQSATRLPPPRRTVLAAGQQEGEEGNCAGCSTT